MNKIYAINKKIPLYIIISALVMATMPALIPINRFFAAGLLFVVTIGFYFYITLCPAKGNWMDIRGVFHAIWIGSITLAALRLLDYQETWQTKTWLNLALAYAMFQAGSFMGIALPERRSSRITKVWNNLRPCRLSFERHENRLFWICIGTTLIGLACFAINVSIRGFIPCFSDDVHAYINFYTRFHVFSVAATAASGLCYYCIKTQKLGRKKNTILVLCIFYLTFLFPILVVSRGVFVVSAISLATVIFYLHHKKLIALILSVLMIFGIYMGASELRSYTNEQLKIFFPSTDIVISDGENHPPSDEPPDNVTNPPGNPVEPPDTTVPPPDGTTEPSDTAPEPPSAPVVFTLPPKLAFLYGYLTVSHDNFNEAVKNISEHSWGVRQLAPFNVILRSNWIETKISESQSYLIRPYLNTYNLITDAYYDFGVLGIAIFSLLLGIVLGAIQTYYEMKKGVFTLLTLGNAMVPVALCFFAPWLSNFTQWMIWGTIFLMFLAATISFDKTEKNPS